MVMASDALRDMQSASTELLSVPIFVLRLAA